MRARGDRALAFATNQPPMLREAPTLAAAETRWTRLLERNATSSRDAWLVAGFRAAGFGVPELKTRYAWELVRAVCSHDHVSFNAQRALMRLFDHHPPSLTWKKEDACTHWLRWLDANRRPHKLPSASDELRRACGSARG